MKRLNLIGKKIGRLTVLEDVGNLLYNKSTWKCKCDCGKIKMLPRQYLFGKNKSKFASCGCLWKEMSSKRAKGNTYCRKEKGISGFNCVYQKYKYTAKQRNITFNLSKDEFKKLMTKNCFYCNLKPSTVQTAYFTSDKWKPTLDAINNSTFIYNGIDRYDNTKGYIVDNCVPCCKNCNRIKNTSSPSELKGLITRIYNNFCKQT